MYLFIWLLLHIAHDLICKIPKVFFIFYAWPDGFECFCRCLLIFLSYGFIVSHGLQGLSVFTLEHHLDLLPSMFVLILSLRVYIQGFQKNLIPWCKSSSILGFGLEHWMKIVEPPNMLLIHQMPSFNVLDNEYAKDRMNIEKMRMILCL